MHPQLIMRRLQKTVLGWGCIVGGCAALLWLLSNDHRLDPVWSMLENTACAAEVTPPAATKNPARTKINSIDSKALINDLHVTDKMQAEADLAPQPRVVIPPGRPAWVEEDFSHDTSDTRRVAVSSGPFQRKHDALRALDRELALATAAFVSDYLGHQTAGTLVPVKLETIRRELIQPGNLYHEPIEIYGLGPMHQSHALLEFSPQFKQQLDERWRTILVAGRVARLGVIAAGVLMALSVVCGYFKVDNATRGYYTTRLQLGTAGAILALVAGGFVLFRLL